MALRNFCQLTLLIFSVLMFSEFASPQTADDSQPAAVPTAEPTSCYNAVSEYNAARADIATNCTGEVKKIFGTETSPATTCHVGLSSCQVFSQQIAESSCLSDLPGNGTPDKSECESILQPESGITCSYLSALDEDALNNLERTRGDLITQLIRERNELSKEGSSWAEDLSKGVEEMQKQEAEVRKAIAALKAQLEELGPKSQQEIQKAYNSYVQSLNDLNQSFEGAAKKFNEAKIQRAQAQMEAKKSCQQAAVDLFTAQKQQREALNHARRNSTSLNNLTGNSQRFEATFKKYLDECLQSEMYLGTMKQIENMYQMAEVDYKNTQKRVHNMRQHFTQNFEKNQQMIQQQTQVQMKNLMDQMAALEQQIQQLRTQLISRQALAQTRRQEQSAALEDIQARLTEANNSKTAVACVRACSGALNGSAPYHLIAPLEEAFRKALLQCQNISTMCSGVASAPSECRVPEQITPAAIEDKATN